MVDHARARAAATERGSRRVDAPVDEAQGRARRRASGALPERARRERELVPPARAVVVDDAAGAGYM